MKSRKHAGLVIRAVLATLATVCFVGRAHAQSEPKRATGTYALSFVRGAGAEGCPSRQELEREVSAKLGHSPFDPSADRSIEILTEKTPDGHRSVVSALDRDGKLLGRRVLIGEEPSCGPIFSATALAVALLIDPEGALSRNSGANEAVGRFDEPAPPPAPAPVASAPPPPPPPPAIEPAPPSAAPAPPPRETPAAVTGADAAVTIGLVPAVSPGVEVYGGGLLGPRWGFALSALYVSKASASRGDTTLDVSLTTFGASLLYSAVNTRSFRLAPDLGLSAGALHVGVRGPPALDSGDHSYFALSLGVRAQASVIGGFFLGVRAGAVIPFVRRELTVEDDPDPIWRMPAAGGIASLGVGWAFF